VLFVILAGLAWSLIEPYTIDRQRLEVAVPHLPDVWDGHVVAVIADLQVGMRLANVSTIRRIVAELVARRPAVVLVAGDFVYAAERDPNAIARRSASLLAPLVEAGLPVYAVLGNHDYAMPSRDDEPDDRVVAAVRTAVEEVGIRLLENETLPLPLPDGGRPRSDDDTLYLAAIGARVPGRDRPVETITELAHDAARIVLMHHPDSFEELPAFTAPFAVAGHTHGGQFRIPFTPDWTWMTYTTEDVVHPDGWIPEFGAEGNRLYVNRGIGFSVLPLRLNCPPEITYVTLRRTEAGDPASPT
jgi:hypothetical protein